ncbi:MAG: phage tail tape measure protein [Maritimibacter sp.]
MTAFEDLDGFDDQLAALESGLQGASSLTAAFTSELQHMGATVDGISTDISGLSRGISHGLKSALDGVVTGSMSLTEALGSVRDAMLRSVYNASVKPVTDHLGGLLGEALGGVLNSFLPFANGAAFSQGRVMPFARGGVVAGATSFAMRGGTGLMGEAGPEAILPLTRGANGKLGVAASGASQPVNVNINVATPDLQGFARSKTQIAAQVGRALARGRRFS